MSIQNKNKEELISELQELNTAYESLKELYQNSMTECKLEVEDLRNSREKLTQNEQRLSLAFTATSDAVWERNYITGQTVYSPRWYEMLGYEDKELEMVFDTFKSLCHPDDFQTTIDKISSTLQNPESKGYVAEFRMLHKNGSWIWIMGRGNVVKRDENLKPLVLCGTNTDISERKNAEQALKVSEEKYKTLLNASPDGIILIDLKGKITEVSEIGFELLGATTRDDLVGKQLSQFIPSNEENTISEIINKTTSEGLIQNVDLKIRKKNQSIFSSEISATLIQDPDGVPLSFMIIIRDISQRKKMETKQIHADRMANLGEMASGIAHEINQPLNIISMIMDRILFESDKTETIKIEFLKNKSNKIFENIMRIRNIIDHIRAFSRDHDDYILTAFNINSSIENAVSMTIEQFKHLGITLNLRLDKQIPKIFGNTYKLEQVIVNLLVNAKDAVMEKKSKKEESFEMIIGIGSYQDNQFLVIEVVDNGIGINDEDINNILLPFYTTKDEGKGTGLGLSICYQIIKEMGGTIDVKSDGFNGTIVKIILDTQKKK